MRTFYENDSVRTVLWERFYRCKKCPCIGGYLPDREHLEALKFKVWIEALDAKIKKMECKVKSKNFTGTRKLYGSGRLSKMASVWWNLHCKFEQRSSLHRSPWRLWNSFGSASLLADSIGIRLDFKYLEPVERWQTNQISQKLELRMVFEFVGDGHRSLQASCSERYKFASNDQRKVKVFVEKVVECVGADWPFCHSPFKQILQNKFLPGTGKFKFPSTKLLSFSFVNSFESSDGQL